ncbi:hypothetical protein J2S30_002552 [Herbaspirillum rubrisubalbicans]|uniref:hypothetical protein n=1 Tax=Herbaspirillum rubrisubalbicans TaxID=80842 RepID=UPI0020A057B8|nr:hypothetical protein [Herbaspirillum rubrisubalbicans]MCP1574173.1 hypothetical protein [Herbaspirillum rubrisubalbicans]
MSTKIQVTPQLIKHQKKLQAAADDVGATANGGPVNPLKLSVAHEQLQNQADKVQKAIDEQVAIFEFDERPLKSEVTAARVFQAVRVHDHVLLPVAREDFRVLPNAYLRSAIFGTGRDVQLKNEQLLSGELEKNTEFTDIAAFEYMDAQLKGYHLCQYDRKVWATCVEFYRDKPLAREGSQDYEKTTFYQFATRMGEMYGPATHRAILASLLRLDTVQFRIRYRGWNLRGQKILNASFQDGSDRGKPLGSDLIHFQVLDGVAELFGPRGWTALHKNVLSHDGLMGWIAGFYASHNCSYWLPFEYLRELSGYPGTAKNFKPAFLAAIEKLKGPSVDESYRIREAKVSLDKKKVAVARKRWKIPEAESGTPKKGEDEAPQTPKN